MGLIFFWCVVHTHITPVMNKQTLFKGLSLEVSNCFSIKPSVLEENFSFFFFFFFPNGQRKRKRAEKDRPPLRIKGAFLFVCLFVCFRRNDVDLRRK